jgi:predicted outer membrane protein
MVRDHGKASAELKSLAQQKGLPPPAGLEPKHRATYDSLAAKTGAAVQDARAFAARALPTLREHLSMAGRLQERMGGTGH